MAAKTQLHYEKLGLQTRVTQLKCGTSLHSYVREAPCKDSEAVVVALVHGYPQSAFQWRHVVHRLLPLDRVALFVPELPGYGISVAGRPTAAARREGQAVTDDEAEAYSKRTMGRALMSALAAVFGRGRRVVLVGHDRGARISHRLVVDAAGAAAPTGKEAEKEEKDSEAAHAILGVVLLDIVPTLAQWQIMSSPVEAARYFHWPLLANASLATDMIMAYGPAKWVRGAHERLAGKGVGCLERIESDEAIDEVYVQLFSSKDTVYHTCLDYRAGAQLEAEEQAEDQKNGRRIAVPTMIMFSRSGLGRSHDVAAVWKDWIQPGVFYEAVPAEDGIGHYLPEEACDQVSNVLVQFIKKFTT